MKSPTLIWRHARENLKKCSLKGLETREDLCFVKYPKPLVFNPNDYLVLEVGAPVLSEKDQGKNLLLLDGTWSYAAKMRKKLPLMEARSLPSHFVTAYPRKQTGCLEPEKGLATVEALFLAYYLMGKNPEGLLAHYYWKDLFLEKNQLLHPC